MAKKKSGSKKKKSIKSRTKIADTFDHGASSDEAEHSVDDAQTSGIQQAQIPGTLEPEEEATLSPAWIEAHALIGVEHIVLRRITQKSDFAEPDMNSDALEKTLARARRIYVDLFYIYFGNGYERHISNPTEKSWRVKLVKRCMDHAFKIVKNLVQLATYELALRSDITDSTQIQIQTTEQAPQEEEKISALVSDTMLRDGIYDFVSTLEDCFIEPDEVKTIAEAMAYDGSSVGTNANGANGLVKSLKDYLEIQPYRQLFRYLQPHEAKAFLTTVVFHLMENPSDGIEVGAKFEDPFNLLNLIDTCLSKSVAREILADLEKQGQANVLLDAKAKSQQTSEPPPIMPIKPTDYVGALQLADDTELWHRIHLLRAKNDFLLDQCTEFYSEFSSSGRH